MTLTRDQILHLEDIAVKEIQVPEWHDSVWIRQLTRAEQDQLLKRQFSDTTMKQNRKAALQEITDVNIYGHDAYVCVCGICDASGKKLFAADEIYKLEAKNGAAIGRIAKAILEFSEMTEDVSEIESIKN
jgi:hypothetical protein